MHTPQETDNLPKHPEMDYTPKPGCPSPERAQPFMTESRPSRPVTHAASDVYAPYSGPSAVTPHPYSWAGGKAKWCRVDRPSGLPTRQDTAGMSEPRFAYKATYFLTITKSSFELPTHVDFILARSNWDRNHFENSEFFKECERIFRDQNLRADIWTFADGAKTLQQNGSVCPSPSEGSNAIATPASSCEPASVSGTPASPAINLIPAPQERIKLQIEKRIQSMQNRLQILEARMEEVQREGSRIVRDARLLLQEAAPQSPFEVKAQPSGKTPVEDIDRSMLCPEEGYSSDEETRTYEMSG